MVLPLTSVTEGFFVHAERQHQLTRVIFFDPSEKVRVNFDVFIRFLSAFYDEGCHRV